MQKRSDLSVGVVLSVVQIFISFHIETLSLLPHYIFLIIELRPSSVKIKYIVPGIAPAPPGALTAAMTFPALRISIPDTLKRGFVVCQHF